LLFYRYILWKLKGGGLLIRLAYALGADKDLGLESKEARKVKLFKAVVEEIGT
jgi:hypothetical protein